MRNSFTKTAFVFVLSLSVIACSKRKEAIIRPKYGNASVTVFTVDSLVFSVTLNGASLVDSLASPIATLSKQFLFYDSIAHLQVYEKTNSNRIVIDTNIRVHIGLNYINIVQLNSDEKPSLPLPPVEPLPGAGFCKVNFVYRAPSGAPFLDSVKCVIRVDTSASGNGSAFRAVDTITLSRYRFSEQYYTVKKGTGGFRTSIYHPVTNTLIQEMSTVSTERYTDFNTVALEAFPYNSTVVYDLKRVF